VAKMAFSWVMLSVPTLRNAYEELLVYLSRVRQQRQSEVRTPWRAEGPYV